MNTQTIISYTTLVALIVFGIEVIFLGEGISAAVMFTCLIFAMRQVSPDFQYGLVIFSIAMHLLLALIPSFAIAHRGFDDGGFAQFLSFANLVILVPWAVNLTIIRRTSGGINKAAEVLGSLGNALLSLMFGGVYLIIVHDNFSGYQSEPTIILVALSIKSALLLIEVILFVWLAILGE